MWLLVTAALALRAAPSLQPQFQFKQVQGGGPGSRGCSDAAACGPCTARPGCAWTSCKGAVPACTTNASTCARVPCGGGKQCTTTAGFRNGTNILHNDITNLLTGPDPRACCAACAAQPGCRGWTLITGMRRCYLKSAAGPTQPNPSGGFVSGSATGPPAPPPTPPFKMGCGHPPQSRLPFCNASLAASARVDDLIFRLTDDEKAAFLLSRNPSVPRLGLGSYDWDTEVLHGVFSNRGNFPPDLTPSPTIFPNGVGLAASFDTELLEKVGAAIGTEQRALNNHVLARHAANGVESGQYQGVNGYAPNCNLYRDARWGRAQETYGESPHHNGASCAAFIRGLQGNDTTHLRIAATVKHYAFYSGCVTASAMPRPCPVPCVWEEHHCDRPWRK